MTIMTKYDILINVLDQLRNEAPGENRRYYPPLDDVEGLNKARARAFIHLFLKSKFGLTSFLEREELITDDTQDGGIDAYYISSEQKRFYLIQSKFRTTEANFHYKEVLLSDLLHMDVVRISKGHDSDENGVPYNHKIRRLLQKIREIPDAARWDYVVVLLANLSKSISPQKLRQLTNGFPAEVFDHERTYRELVFPVVQGTYYDPEELSLSINLSNTTSSSAKITYNVATETTECDITVLFVPTIEIAKALHKYRNSILKYNPRSYLELENNNVNRAIASTITQLRTNEFALYNNGITMLSFGTHFSERIGQKDKAQLIVTQPQIINGGQTAFTLSRLYEQYLASGDVNEIFSNKEVLLKVITFQTDPPADGDKYLKLIEAISKATNQQSPVDEADRRSNDLIQIKLQQFIFDTYGYFYERKRGEFADGIRAGYINRKQIVGRDIIVRMCRCCDLEPAEAWRSLKELFAPHNFNRTLNNEERFPEYFFAFKCYETIAAMKERFKRDKNNRYGVSTYGNGLIYGQYAVTAACRIQYQGEDSLSKVEQIVNGVLGRWLEFEAHVVGLQTNSAYFRRYTDDEGVLREQLNFDNYYKGRTVNDDVRSFFIA